MMNIPLLKRLLELASFLKLLNETAQDLGYESLKEEQVDAVSNFLKGRDAFVSLPTGFGKSLCFAMIPKVIDRLKAFFWNGVTSA